MSPASGRLRSPFTGRVASASDAGLSSSGRRSAKIDGPPTWDGDATTSKISFEGWYRALENKLLVNKDHFDDEEAMKSYVENRLTGDALDSLLPFLADDHPDKITTLEELLQWLQHEYVDQTAKQKARKDYDKLQMKPSDTLQGFKNDFVRLAGRAKKAKADWKEDFNDKLTVQLRDQMTIAFVNPDVDFNNFVSLAMQHDIQNKQNYERRQAAKSTGTMTGGSSSRTRIRQGGARPAGGSSSTPSQSPAARPDKLLAPAGPEEMKQLIKEGKCFLCRKQGHMTGSCPDKNLYRPQRPRLTEDRIQEIVDKYYPPKDAPDAADDTSDVGSDGDSDPKN
ncbi:hypothetical protein QBC37DRAFT_299689 [Rhypophila decipiens]|uniref:CCHC-type domain-containing protein n=1 Tax=Rhypophila decipiens TaxID=261697 RepID=A0AAN7B123_9PEZI|nr:hypothetical protein QBC37DRAFT_299689 [Rhypophila decipiens]